MVDEQGRMSPDDRAAVVAPCIASGLGILGRPLRTGCENTRWLVPELDGGSGLDLKAERERESVCVCGFARLPLASSCGLPVPSPQSKIKARSIAQNVGTACPCHDPLSRVRDTTCAFNPHSTSLYHRIATRGAVAVTLPFHPSSFDRLSSVY